MNLSFHNHSNPTFELVLQKRDFHGNSTDQTKSFKTDDPVALERFFIRNSGRPKKKKRKKVDAAKKEDVDKIVAEVKKYQDKKDSKDGH